MIMESRFDGEKIINLQLNNTILIAALDILMDLYAFFYNPHDWTNTMVSFPLCNNWPQWLIKIKLDSYINFIIFSIA